MLTSLVAFFWIAFAPPAPVTKPAPVAKPAPVVRVAAAPTADEVIKNVQQFYKKRERVTAKFRQQVTNVTFGETKTSDGMMWIQTPGKMRWDYYSKPRKGKVSTKKSFISNGSYLYVIEHDNRQVVKKNLEKDLMPVAVSFLYGKGDLATDFTGALDTSGKYGGKDETVLELTPKQPSAQYKKLFLVVDPTDWRVKQSIIVDSADNVNHFRFYEPDFEKQVDAAWFEFEPKKVPTYRVVDADAQDKAGAGAGAAPGAGAGSGAAAGSGAGSAAPAPAPKPAPAPAPKPATPPAAPAKK